MRLVLEPRYLFDGSVAAVAQHAHDHDHHDDHHNDPHHGDASAAAKDTPAAAQSGKPWDDRHHHPAANDNPNATEILFVDPRVANWQTLVQGLDSNVQVVVIDPNRDGLEQVTDALAGRTGLTSIQFLTYGTSGAIELGNSTINVASLTANAAEVASWRSSMVDGADILFWGCDVGAGAAGQAFIGTVHDLTGVEVGASTDATGSAALGGDWTLEATTGPLLHGTSPFSAEALAAYDTVLDAPIPTVTISAPTNVPLGSSFSETVTFTNTASSGVGYGPFIELFVPSNTDPLNGTPTEVASLTSATYLGASVSYQTITLSDQIAGHMGTVGAIDPLVLDSSGNATFVAAPTGFKAGDTMYVLTLPFGSFTPGQPTASVTLNFSLDSKSDLGTSALNIAAIGGFQYGADALNDPTTDPSIRGTAGTPTVTGGTDGLVTGTSNVTLIDVTTVANTWPGEGETATGPSFPGSYVVTLTPAPIVSGDAITNLSYTITLPDDVQYTGGTISVTGGGTVTVTPSSSTPGGTLTVDFSSISSAQTITIPFYVPQVNGSSAQILDPATGNSTLVQLNPTWSYTADNWTDTTSGAFDTSAHTVSGSGQNTDAEFTAKSLAVQVSDTISNDTGTSGFTPGDTVAYTIHFQVSDYFDLNNLVLSDILSDGMTLDPNMAPVLNIVESGAATNNISFGTIADLGTTVNGESVVTSGSNVNWSYSRDNTSNTSTGGETTLTFNVGQLLSTTGGILSSNLPGSTSGTYGTVTFYATVLDKYSETQGASGNLTVTAQSIREGDSTYDSVTGSGTVTSHATSQSHSQSDSSSLSNTVAEGNLELDIVDVNGVAPGSTVHIMPGDLVTYQLTYDLTTGDFGDLNLTGYVPLPVFNVPGSFSVDDSANPAANTYSIVTNPSGNTPTITTDTTANSVNFNFGTYDTAANPAGTKVVVNFTLVASNAPFADGLFLTTEGQSHFTNLDTPTVSTAVTAIKQQVLDEPSLTLKTGIVSVVNDSDSAKGGVTYTGDTGSSNADPTSIFDPATDSGVFVSSIPTAIGDAENQNVAGVDGSDTVRVVETVQNTGHGDAYDLIVNGALPSGYTATDVTSVTITRGDGTVLDTITDSTAIGNFFSSAGVTVSAKGGDPTGLALYGTGDASHRDVLYVSYDLPIAADQVAGATLTATGSVLAFANVHGATNFITGGSAVGDPSSNLTDTATIMTPAPTLAKDVTAGDDTTNVSLYSVVAGETITYTVTLTLPEGALTAGSGDIELVDTLASGTSYISSSENTVYGSNVMASGGTPGVSYNAGTRTLTVDIGNEILNSNADANGTVTFTYQAQILNSGSNNTTYTNNAQFEWSGTTLSASKTVTEKDPNVTATLTADKSSPLFSGETVTYTLVLSDATAPAQDLLDTITLPAGLTWVPNSLMQTVGTGATLDQSSHTIAISQLAVSGSETFTFQATVDNNEPAGTALNVTTSAAYSSMPGTVTNEKTFTAPANKSLSTGTFTPVLTIVDESNATTATDGGTAPTQSAPQTSADAVIGEIVRMKAYVQVPEGQNVTALNITLPSTLTFLNDGSATVAIASPGADTQSSTLDPSGDNNGGTTPGLQVNDTTGFNPATYNPTAAFDGSHITYTGNVVTFDFGTVTNNDASATANYVVVEFNALVTNVTGNQDGTTLTSSLKVNNAGTAATDAVHVKEPTVTIAKSVTAIDEATGVVSWKVVLTNTGDTTAYDVSLVDAEPNTSANEGNIADTAHTGNATNLNITSGDGTTELAATMDLAAGKSETFTYTTTVTSTAAPVPDATATVTYGSLNENNSSFAGTFYGTTYNTGAGNLGDGADSSSTGERTGADGVGGALNDYAASATVGLGDVSGNVWNDLGSPLNVANETYDSTYDTELLGITLTGTWTGQSSSSTVMTDVSGNYSFLLPDNVATSIAAPATTTSSSTGGGTETLVYDTSNSTTFHHTETGLSGGNASISVTASAGSAITGINYAYRLPDTAPVLASWGSTSAASPVNYTMGGSAVVLGSGSSSVSDTQLDQLIADSGTNDYNGTVLTVARDGGANANDVFSGAGSSGSGLFLSSGTIKYNGTTIGTYTLSSGTLTVTFGAGTSSASVKAVLDNLTYSNNSASSQLASGVLIDASLTDHNTETGTTAGNPYQGTGGVMTSNTVQVLLDIAPSAVAAAFTDPNDTAASGAAVALSPSIVVTNTSATFSQMVLTVTTNYLSSEDVLTFTNSPGTMGNIAGVWDATSGTMTLTSSGNSATAAQWQAALRAVKYYDSSDVPNTASRTVTIDATSTGGEDISGNLATVSVTAVNDSPVLDSGITVTLADSVEDVSGAPSGAVGTLISALAGIGTSPANVTDTDDAGLNNGASLNNLTGIAITQADTTDGNWYYSTNGGTTWTEFASSGMTAISNANALHLLADANTRIYFQPNVLNFNGTINPALTFRAWDQFDSVANGALTNIGSTFGTNAANNAAGTAYSIATDVLSLDVLPVDDPPVVTGVTGTGGSAVTFTDPNDTSASAAAITVAPALNVSDVDNATFASATIQITGNYQSGEDVLSFTNTSGMGNIAVTSNSGGILTLTSSGATATVAQWQAALRAVTYYDSSDTPNNSDRTVTITVNDGGSTANGGQPTSDPVTQTIHVTAVNDSPVLDTGVSVSLTGSTEDVLGAPMNGTTTGSTLISALAGIGSGASNVTDTDDAGLNNGASLNNLTGIAITHADTSEGNWYYSTDGGAHWTEFASSGMTAISNANALHLLADANTRIYFQPTVANWNGTITNGLTFRAWDQFDGVANGALTDIGSTFGTSAANNAAGTAYSSATDTIPIVVAAVNDAPIASGDQILYVAGTSVNSLFTPSFSDTADQQYNAGTNPNGSVANTLAGIAIIGDAANATTQGVWKYSVDGGTTYTTISTSVSDSSALILPKSALIEFIGVGGYSGTPGALTVRLIDSSTDVNVTTGVSGLTLQGGSTAYTGIDVSGSHDDTPTAVSAATVQLNTIVGTSVAGTYIEPNDAAASGAATAVNDSLVLSALTYKSATVQITGNYQSGEDVLVFTNDPSTMGNITGSYNSSTGTMTLSSAGQTATADDWQAALRAVMYYDSSDRPNTANRTATLNIVDSTNNSSSLGTSTITVTAVNDSPILDTGVSVSLTGSTEDVLGAPMNGTTTGSTLISALIGVGTGPSNVTDPDGAGVIDGATPGVTGIAITHADTSEGNWYYTTDGGAHWTEFASSGMTAISNANALHLIADANTRIYFQPITPNWNGTIANALTFRAWDQYDGVANGALSNIGSTFGTNASANAAGGAYSVATDTIPLVDAAVNDAPIASGSATLAAVLENATTPPGDTVSNLFSSHFNDSTDTVSGGSSANSFAGIAITDNQSTSAQGVWNYTIDNGTTWVAIPTTGLSDNAAIILPPTARIEFVPTHGYSGTPGALTVRLIDGSNTANADVAFSASSDVSSNGGITAISAATIPLTTSVTAPSISSPPPPPPPPPVVLSPPPPPPPPDPPPTVPIPPVALTLSPPGTGPGTGGGDPPVIGGGLGGLAQSLNSPGAALEISERQLADNSFSTDLYLTGSVGNRFAIVEQVMTVPVPPTIFQHSDPNEKLVFEATRPDGSPLPNWMKFDTDNMVFTGTPPLSARGAVDIVITAKDQHGNKAAAQFQILIGEQVGRPRGPTPNGGPRPGNAPNQGNAPIPGIGPIPGGRPIQGGAPARSGENLTPPGFEPDIRHAAFAPPRDGAMPDLFASLATRPEAQIVRLAPRALPAAAPDGRSAFSLQLRDGGRAGQLANARAFLEAIEKTTGNALS